MLQDELDQITRLSRELGIWTVIPSVHPLPEARPHNSMYVVSDAGKVVTRYDERMLSTTKITWMYTPGTEPVTFEVDGYRFGLALGLDVLFPELFTEYDRLDVDAVLVSYASTGVGQNEHIGVQTRGTRREQHLLDQPGRAGQPRGRPGLGRERSARESGRSRTGGQYAGDRGDRPAPGGREPGRPGLPAPDAGARRLLRPHTSGC